MIAALAQALSDGSPVDWRGATALHRAAEQGDVAGIESLLAASDPNARGPHGKTPLMMAASGGFSRYTDCVKVLLSHSDPSARDKDGWTALMHAALGGSEEILKILLPPSDARAVARFGVTALHLAAQEAHVECVEALLPFSDARAIADDGQSALAKVLVSGLNFYLSTKSPAKRHDECADLLAGGSMPHEAEVAFEKLGPERMPRYAAQREAAEIAAAAEEGARSGRAAPVVECTRDVVSERSGAAQASSQTGGPERHLRKRAPRL